MGGIPMYMCPVTDAGVTKEEPAQEKIIRLQKNAGRSVQWSLGHMGEEGCHETGDQRKRKARP
eukprot:1834205-Pyramimonas_sp.AAC.1